MSSKKKKKSDLKFRYLKKLYYVSFSPDFFKIDGSLSSFDPALGKGVFANICEISRSNTESF